MAQKKTKKELSHTVDDKSPVGASASSGYTVVARRYRPQQFSDLIGQEHVAQTLVNALTSNRVAHAYLFTGARGVGKTSSARILAKALNCVTGPTPTPCDQCAICLSIAEGDDVDVLEIDGASNNKVEEIRDLRQNVGFKPTRARFKIYIIDEVHMLTTAAFNALLKTLEEPPDHVKFIFATTEIHKIPITILSRCQRFDFAHVGPDKILESLVHIVEKEGITAEREALNLIARRAAGSMRDSQTLLDQALSLAQGQLRLVDVQKLLGLVSDDVLQSLAEAILENRPDQALMLLQAQAQAGMQLNEILDQLIEFWRGLMLATIDHIDPVLMEVPDSVLQLLKNKAGRYSSESLLAGLDLLTQAKVKLRGQVQIRLILEMTIIRLCQVSDLVSLSSLVQQLQSGGASLVVPRTTRPAVEPPQKRTPSLSSATEPGVTAPVASEHEKKKLADDDGTPQIAVDSEVHLWERFLQELTPMISAQIRRVTHLPAISAPNSLAIRFLPGYSSEYEQFSSDRYLETFRAALKEISGTNWVVKTELLPGEGTSTAGPQVILPKSEILQLPFFKQAEEILGAKLMNMADDFNPKVGLWNENQARTDSPDITEE